MISLKMRVIGWPGASIVSLLVAVIVVSCATCAEEKAGEHAERFYFDEGGRIRVPVLVFGERCHFCLDTGSTSTLFHPDFRGRLGPKVKDEDATTAVDDKIIEAFNHPPVVIGVKPPETYRPDGYAFCFKSRPGGDDFWTRYRGMLGMSYLSSKVLHISFDESFAELRPSATEDDRHREAIRFFRAIPHILLRVSSDGFQSFAIDTGATENVGIRSDLFQKLVRQRKIRLTQSKAIIGVDNESTKRSGILDNLELGPYRFTNVSVLEMPMNLLGARFLSRFDLELDFPNRIARFKPGRRIDLPDRRYRTGFGVARVNGRTFIGETQPDGVGWNAGIRDDDDLIAIDKTPVDELTILKIRDLLCDPGVEREFVVRRNGVERTVMLRLSSEPDPFPEKPVRQADPDGED